MEKWNNGILDLDRDPIFNRNLSKQVKRVPPR